MVAQWWDMDDHAPDMIEGHSRAAIQALKQRKMEGKVYNYFAPIINKAILLEIVRCSMRFHLDDVYVDMMDQFNIHPLPYIKITDHLQYNAKMMHRLSQLGKLKEVRR